MKREIYVLVVGYTNKGVNISHSKTQRNVIKAFEHIGSPLVTTEPYEYKYNMGKAAISLLFRLHIFLYQNRSNLIVLHCKIFRLSKLILLAMQKANSICVKKYENCRYFSKYQTC